MRSRLRRAAAGSGLMLLVVGCATPWEMVRVRPASTHCPEIAVERGMPADTTDLRWYRVDDARDVKLGSAWCATVGPPSLRMEVADEFTPWTESSGVIVATWNMNLGGGDLYGLLDGELGLDCAAPETREGVPPFVLMLQEVWRVPGGLPAVTGGDPVPWTIDPEPSGSENPDIVDAAERCGLSLVFVASARNGPDSGSRPGEDKGNAILSSLPLSAPLALELPFEAGRMGGRQRPPTPRVARGCAS